MEAKLETGDIAYIDYDLWIVGTGQPRTLHETTHAEVAKEAGKYDEKRAYVPLAIVVGKERVPKGLDEALLGASVGETKEVVIPPEKGAGDRDAKLVKLYPIREFHRREVDPHPGLDVHMEGRHGVIVAVTAGRVRVDFNNPLAGRTLQYTVTVVRRADTEEDKVRAILDMDYGLADKFRIFPKETEVDVFIPDMCKTDERWFVSKFRVVADLREFAGIPKVRFVEEYEKKEEKKTDEAKAEPAAEEPPAEVQPAKVEAAQKRSEPTKKSRAPPKAKGRRKSPAKADDRSEEELSTAEQKSPEEL